MLVYCHILVNCDNMAVVNILASSTSKAKLVMQLLCSLHFICATYQVSIHEVHLAGSYNVFADATESRQVSDSSFRTSMGSPSKPATRLAVNNLAKVAKGLIVNSLAPSSRKTYSSA